RAPEEARTLKPRALIKRRRAPSHSTSTCHIRQKLSSPPPRVPPGPQTNPSASSPRRHRLKPVLHKPLPRLSAPAREALPMRMELHPPHLLLHRDAHPLRDAVLGNQRIRTFNQPPFRFGRLIYLTPKYENGRTHDALDIDAMHIANLGQHPLAFIERMPELAQCDEIISRRKFTHSVRFRFHKNTSSSRTPAGTSTIHA